MEILEYDWSKPGARVLLRDLLCGRLENAIKAETDITQDELADRVAAVTAELQQSEILVGEPARADGPARLRVPCTRFRCGDSRGHFHDIETVDIFLPVLKGDPALLVARPGGGGGPDVNGTSYDKRANAITFRLDMAPNTKEELDRRVVAIRELIAKSNTELATWNEGVETTVRSRLVAIQAKQASAQAEKDNLGLPSFKAPTSSAKPERAAVTRLARLEDRTPMKPPTFLSYVHENSGEVGRLKDDLKKAGLETWIDREQLEAGSRWKREIRQAISTGGGFIACFSKELEKRDRSYVYEELTVAVEEIRQRPHNQPWFIPVRLNDCTIPDLDIGAGETLRDIQSIDWFEDSAGAADEIARVLSRPRPGPEV